MTVSANDTNLRTVGWPTQDVGGHRQRRIRTVLRGASRDDVARIVVEAASARQQLSVISTGRNWGLGSAMPIRDGSAVLDLSAMDEIRSLDTERGIAVVEPGVTQRMLAAAVSGTPWLLNVTSSCADTSVVGNALDRGDGTIRARSEDVLGLEAVLADGSVITTGGLTVDGVYRGRTAGPDLTQALVQSNLAVVTAAVVSLIARPESIRLCHALVPRGAALAALDVLASLVAMMPCLGMPRLREFQLAGPATDPRSDTLSVLIPVFGPAAVVDLVARHIAECLSSLDASAVVRCVDTESTPPDDPLYPRTLVARGIPTCELVRHALRGDSCDVDQHAPAGLLIVLPLIPLDRAGAHQAVTMLRTLTRDYPGTVTVEVNVAATHTARAVVQIGFDRTSARQTHRAHALRELLWQAFAGQMYRADIDHADGALRAQDATNARMLDALKTAVDPDDIVLPGRFLASRRARS